MDRPNRNVLQIDEGEKKKKILRKKCRKKEKRGGEALSGRSPELLSVEARDK